MIAASESAPKIVAPKIVAPKIVAPEVVAPKIVAPEVVAPEVVAPEIVAPEVVAPEIVAPEDGRPRPKAGVLDIAAYVGGKARAEGFAHPLKLSGNENVLGCSPRARAAFEAASGRLHLYPDGAAGPLRAALTQKFSLEPERLVFGCGSDELFSLLAQVYCEPGDNVVQGRYGFMTFRIVGRAAQAQVRFTPEPNYRVDVDAMLEAVDDRTRLVFLANPGNPTGTFLTAPEVARLHAGLPGRVVLVLDGAYAECAEDPDFDDGIALARRAENVIVTRTFSKMYGLAALRVGWGYGPAAMIDALERIRPAFNVSLPAIEAAVEALADDAFLEDSRALLRRWRPWMMQQLGGLGLRPVASQANFVMAVFPEAPGRTAGGAEGFLAARGVLVRHLAGYGIPEALRITVGREEDNRRVIEGLTAFMTG